MDVQICRALTLGLLLAAAPAGCASHKELSAPCKRPDSALSYQAEWQATHSPVSEQLTKLAHPSADCGPMTLINSNRDGLIATITEASHQ